jgi:CDP-diacylglycerol---glycerol-3-phosphate 3-phosphatidyltransferase
MRQNLEIANLLSWLRIFLTPVVMLLLVLNDWAPAYIVAAVLFAFAEITDILDGYFARKYGSVSNLGIFLDLTADKLFTAGVLVVMVEQRVISSWLVAIILGREFLITGVRTYAASAGVVIPAGKWGKIKTVLTGVSLTWLILWHDAAVRSNGVLREAYNWTIGGNIQPVAWFLLLAWPLVYLMVIITVYSGFLYLRDAAYLFMDKPAMPKSADAPNETANKVETGRK